MPVFPLSLDFVYNIDWAPPLSEIDRQLHDKYSLVPSGREFIESMIKPMG